MQNAGEKVLDLTLDLRSYSGSGDTHTHDYHQLVLPVEGRLDMVFDSESGAVEAEHGAIISAHSLHHYRARGDNRFIVADVPRDLAPSLARLPAFN